jgi:IPT/TIG domain
MAYVPADHRGPASIPSTITAGKSEANSRRGRKVWILALLAATALISPLLLAQGGATITSVDPSSGKVNDSVTVTGQNLGKASVPAIFLSDDKEDFKATIVEQTDEKIVLKVPEVKPGSYNISVQAGNTIIIKPVRFTVQD